tara:strand:+ start:808 stop:1074 length:267 start_codon:yes stop_codon:yes gene_type:complete
MTHNKNTYVILNTTEITTTDLDGESNSLIDFSQLLNRNASMLRYSVNGEKALVKYSKEQPAFLDSKTKYTHEEILVVIATSAWTAAEE